MRGRPDRPFFVLSQVVTREVGRRVGLSPIAFWPEVLRVEDVLEVLVRVQGAISEQLAVRAHVRRLAANAALPLARDDDGVGC